VRLQTTSYSCGPNALDNALECYKDHGYAERETMRLCHTTKRGTGEKNLRRAAKRRGHKSQAWNTTNAEKAVDNLLNAILSGWPVILAVDRDDHWVTVVGALGEKFILFDPESSSKNRKKNGMHVFSRIKLLHRWKGKKGKYFGLIIFPRRYKN